MKYLGGDVSTGTVLRIVGMLAFEEIRAGFCVFVGECMVREFSSFAKDRPPDLLSPARWLIIQDV